MGDTVNHIGGAGHLPECQPDALLDPPLICICEELRAYADRVLGAAREAVAAILPHYGKYDGWVMRDEPLAVIDALREEQK